MIIVIVIIVIMIMIVIVMIVMAHPDDAVVQAPLPTNIVPTNIA